MVERVAAHEYSFEPRGGHFWRRSPDVGRPVRRRIALKVIKLGMDTKAVVARFEAERQALAMMDHPNMAKVLDAGTTETGRPYFVMELVRGIRITDYCDQNQLTTKERLGLFIKICQAIQHAHQKGIVHRDLKPSNIMVTLHDGVPVPKVIDFGIAKAMEGRLTDATVYTQLNQFIGTPAYMSPEQAEMSGLDIDTRSDGTKLSRGLRLRILSRHPRIVDIMPFINDVTQILQAVQQGDPKAAGELLPLVYEELRKLAAAKMSREAAGHTLQPTALVHEAWLRLVGDQEKEWAGRAHFFAAAAEAMRRILIDKARRRRAVRHGGEQQRVDLEELELACPLPDDQLLAVDEALDKLASAHPRQAELVKLRYFVGMTVQQAARVLGISADTAKDDAAHARAWLFREMTKSDSTDGK
jgi:RNA polymerase sigma factor (TIGR02999 family)